MCRRWPERRWLLLLLLLMEDGGGGSRNKLRPGTGTGSGGARRTAHRNPGKGGTAPASATAPTQAEEARWTRVDTLIFLCDYLRLLFTMANFPLL